jgi:hypothetical protein
MSDEQTNMASEQPMGPFLIGGGIGLLCGLIIGSLCGAFCARSVMAAVGALRRRFEPEDPFPFEFLAQ